MSMVSKRVLPFLTFAVAFGAIACGQIRNSGDKTAQRGGTNTAGNGNSTDPVTLPNNPNILLGDPNTNTPASPANPNASANPNATANPNAINPNTLDPNSAANPNHLVNFGKPDPMVVIDPNAKNGFDPNQVYTEADNGYPGCENPAQIDFGFNQVNGCPDTIGTQLPMQSYCHMNYNFPVTWYQTNPPASGDHWPDPSHALGVNVVPVPREYYVHSMEHGAVILAYNCPNGCDYELQVMRDVVAARADRSFKVLMTPDARMPANSFAAISWTWLYPFSVPDAAKLICFIDQHYNHARENSLSL